MSDRHAGDMKILQRLVVGVDGSPGSTEAIALGIRLARTHESELFFAHAIDYMLAANESGAAVIEALTSEGETILSKARTMALEAGVRSDAAILEGRPEYAIVRHAGSVDASAIVVGTRGNSGMERFFLGSTAEGVLRLAMAPVFVAHGTALMSPHTFERILVAIDNSDPSDAAVEFATTLAAEHGSRLTFLHVVDEGTLYEEAANYAGATYPVLHEWLDEANIISGAAAQRAEGIGIQSVETAVVTGDPVNEIECFAASDRSDLIVVGAHGRRGLRHLMMGSVTHGVVRRSAVPVVVVRAAVRSQEPVVQTLDEGTIETIHPHVDQHGYVTLREDS